MLAAALVPATLLKRALV